MRLPVPPPAPCADLLEAAASDPTRLAEIRLDPTLARDPEYHPWDWFVQKDPPEGFSREEWWTAVRAQRAGSARPTSLTTGTGAPLTYNLPGPLLRLIDDTTSRVRAELRLPDAVSGPSDHERYLTSSLVEEVTSSCRIDGATIPRLRAKQMIYDRREPRDHDERMILDAYRTMRHVVDVKDAPLTPDLVRGLHRRLTETCHEDPDGPGRLRRPGETRATVPGGEPRKPVLRVPPPAEELPERLERLCAFANDVDSSQGPYLPPLLRAITLHYVVVQDQYFEEANGRLARALFFWGMLHQGFALAEYLSPSRLLERAPAQYARSYLRSENDEGDLTHFFLHQVGVVSRSVDALNDYLRNRAGRLTNANRLLRRLGLNQRQVVLLESFLRDPSGATTVASHQRMHGVVTQTARTDLQDLQSRGLLTVVKQGRRMVWFPVPDLASRVGVGAPGPR